MHHNVTPEALQHTADKLGITVKFSTAVQKLVDVHAAALSYTAPGRKALGDILIDTAPDKWESAFSEYATVGTLPDESAIRHAAKKSVVPAIIGAVKADRDNIIKQLYPAAAKAAKAINDAATAGITDLGNYEWAMRHNAGPALLDAQNAIVRLNAYADIVCDLIDGLQDGNVSLRVAALIGLPDALAPLPITVAHTPYADVRFSQGAFTRQATPEAEQAWEDNGALRRADQTTRLLEVANGKYNGFTLAPAATIAEALNRADRINDSMQSHVLNPTQRPDLA